MAPNHEIAQMCHHSIYFRGSGKPEASVDKHAGSATGRIWMARRGCQKIGVLQFCSMGDVRIFGGGEG